MLLARAKKASLERRTASGCKPEKGHCALERSIGGSSEELRLHTNQKEFIPCSSEDFVARAKALMEITRDKLLARAREASLEQASQFQISISTGFCQILGLLLQIFFLGSRVYIWGYFSSFL